MIRTLATQRVDWIRVMHAAHNHGVLPLFVRNLVAAVGDTVPHEILQTLKRAVLAHTTRNLVLTNILTEILLAFDEEGIPAIPLKGPVLAMVAYGDVSLRAYNDLDILVPRTHVFRAMNMLGARGYSPTFRLTRGQEEALFRFQHHHSLQTADHDALVELHWSLKVGATWLKFSEGPIWERSWIATLNGVPVRCLLYTSPSPRDS